MIRDQTLWRIRGRFLFTVLRRPWSFFFHLLMRQMINMSCGHKWWQLCVIVFTDSWQMSSAGTSVPHLLINWSNICNECSLIPQVSLCRNMKHIELRAGLHYRHKVQGEFNHLTHSGWRRQKLMSWLLQQKTNIRLKSL